MRNKNNKIIALILNSSIVVMELIALVLSFNRNSSNMFVFYTEDSNIFTLIVSLLYIIYIFTHYKDLRLPKWLKTLRYASTCCLTLTFLVVIFILCPMYGINSYSYMLFNNSMLFHHLLCPIISFISLVFFEENKTITKKYSMYALVPTMFYGITLIILNILHIVTGPYPFLEVYNQPILMSVVWIVVIIGGSYFIDLMIYKLIKKTNKV